MVVTSAAAEDMQTVAAAAEQSPAGVRASLFAAAPLIVDDYAGAAATLAADWYDELREATALRRAFTSSPADPVAEDVVAAVVARSTVALYDLEQQAKILAEDFEQALSASLSEMDRQLQPLVAAGFRDTITESVVEDPEAVGWRRYARPGACKFCLMLSDRGAVYTDVTADFAAHWSCHCTAGPSWDPEAPRADVIQYVASRRRQTDAQRAQVRAYVNKHYPDAPG